MGKIELKIKYGDVLRRIDLSQAKYGNSSVSLSTLKQTVREAFNIPVATEFTIVYTDNESDQVTLGGDDEVEDAFHNQGLVHAMVVPQTARVKIILKIKYGDILRRIDLNQSKYNDSAKTLSTLKQTVREAFNIPDTTEFTIVYIDNQNEMVTMGGDDEVEDAFYNQGLNLVHAIVVAQGEPQWSAQDARLQERKELMIQNCARLKIKYGDILRCIDLNDPKYGNSAKSFTRFKRTVREAFDIPVATKFTIVYTDNQNDQVTIGGSNEVENAFYHQGLNPVHATVVLQGESQCSAQDARPSEQLTSNPPPWAADIITKLDKLLLLAVNKQLMMERGVELGRSLSIKTEEQLMGVDDSPVHDSRVEPSKDDLPSENCSYEDGWFDVAQSGIDSETILRRAAILRQRRILTDEFGDGDELF